jgi:hypothetical protein
MDWKIKDLGTLQRYCGITVGRCGNRLTISQSDYIKDLLDWYQTTSNTKLSPSKFPLKVDSLQQFSEQNAVLLEPNKAKFYQKALGCLQYLASATRLDLAMTTSHLAQFTVKPTELHREALNQVFRYLLYSHTTGITYSHNQPMDPVCFSDSNHVGLQKIRIM